MQKAIRPVRNCSLTGFTLIEILLVVILLGVAVGLVIPNFGSTYANFQLKEAAENISYLMRYAQSRAVIKNAIHRFNFSSDYSQYWISQAKSEEQDQDAETVFRRISGRLGRTFEIPKEITIDSSRSLIQFYPDGKIDKVKMYLSNTRKRTLTVSTEEQTGYVYLFDFRVP